MVLDKPAYEQLIDYLSSSKEIFQNNQGAAADAPTLEAVIEEQIGEQIITLCTQHEELETNHRSIIVREVDGIVYDIQQLLSDYWEKPVAPHQIEFVAEFSGLVKNIFDSAIADLMD